MSLSEYGLRPRVVVLDHTAELGGAELALGRMLDALPEEACDVRVVLFADGPLVGRMRSAGHKVEVLLLDPSVATASRTTGSASALRQGLRTLPFVARLSDRLRDLRPDVVHTTSLKADLLGLAAARLARVPVVWHVHDRIETDYLPASTVRAFRVLARRGPAAVIANSDATAATLPGARRLSVIPPGLSPGQVAADPGSRPVADPPVVGMLGRISATKGQLELVRAAALVVRERPDVRFRIIGSPMFGQDDYEAQVRSEISRLGLDDRVGLAGFVEDPAAALDELSVCVHASPVPEPFGQVVVEAMARGVRVVATRSGGIPEIVESGGSSAPLGWLVEPGDVTDLARGILAALMDARAGERAERAWQSVQDRYLAAGTAQDVLGVWLRVGRRRPGH